MQKVVYDVMLRMFYCAGIVRRFTHVFCVIF